MFIPDLYVGIILGVVGIAIIGFLHRTYSGWIKARDAFYKPMSIVHQTDKTPAQVGASSRQAGCFLGLFRMAVPLAFLLMIEVIDRGSIREAILFFMRRLIEFFQQLLAGI